MHRCADFDATLGGKATGETQHLTAITLHREVGDGAALDGIAQMQRPAEDGRQFHPQPCMAHHLLRPAPVIGVGGMVQAQQFTCTGDRLPDLKSKALLSHAVLHRQCAHFKLVALDFMAGLGRIWWNRARLFRKRQVRVAGGVRLHHRLITTKGGSYAKLLLRPIDIG